MTIIQNEYTIGIKQFCVLNDNKVVVGQQNGVTSIWSYSRPKQLKFIRTHEGESSEIRKLLPYFEDKFISINKKSEIKIWETNTGRCKLVLQGRPFYCIDQAVMLPNNLLVVSGYSSPDYACFDVWDLDTKMCIHKEKEYSKLPGYMLLQTTSEGFLVVAKTNSLEVCVWEVSRSECKLIFKKTLNRDRDEKISSMAVLKTGEIAVASNKRFYKVSSSGKIDFCKTLYDIKDNDNVIDAIFPVASDKVLIVDQMGTSPGKIVLWNYSSNKRETLGVSSVQAQKHIVLEKQGALLSLCTNKIEIHEFSENIFLPQGS